MFSKFYFYKFSKAVILILSFSFILCGCESKQESERIPIRIIFTKLSDTFIQEHNKLSDDAENLLKGLNGNLDKCKHSFILDPSLIRVDGYKADTSIATIIEKSRVAKSNAERDFKLVEQNLKSITIPENFLQKESSHSDSLFHIFLIPDNVGTDSIIVFSDKKNTDSLKIANKKYRTYFNLTEIRSKILSILCENPKASITLLINPPDAVDTTRVVPPVSSTIIKTHTEAVEVGRPPVTHRPFVGRRVQSDNGDLTIIKGSEGCAICTRYYSVTDNLGRVRQVTQRNSTECCPCGKTIEMRGRTYRMECNEGGSNRLVIAD